MMKFEEFEYKRPDIKQYQKEIKKLTDVIGSDVDVSTELEAIYKFFEIMDELESLETIASIRNAIDTTDKFYEKNKNFLI